MMKQMKQVLDVEVINGTRLETATYGIMRLQLNALIARKVETRTDSIRQRTAPSHVLFGFVGNTTYYKAQRLHDFSNIMYRCDVGNIPVLA
jgi:hypothetical protein